MASSQCLILYINSAASETTHAQTLRSLGFHVVETGDIPDRETLQTFHAVVIRTSPGCPLPSVANRVRAQPRFGRRVLIALVPPAVSAREKRDAVDSGFDLVLAEDCTARDLAAAILALLRRFPEHRCVLRSVTGRRKAA